MRGELLGGRLLLGQAVERASSPNQIRAVDSHHAPIREKFLQRLSRNRIRALVTIGRQQDHTVRYVKIRIARRQSLSVGLNDDGHWQFDNVQWSPVLIAHGSEPLQVFLQRRVVIILGILLDDCDHGVWVHKPRQIIHVSVRVVAHNSVGEPQDVGDASPRE